MLPGDSKGSQLPPELTHNIVTLSFVEYLHSAITGLATTTTPLVNHDLGDHPTCAEVIRYKKAHIQSEGPMLYNPVPQLLQSSLQLRDVTLKVLSEILGIPIVKDGQIKRCVILIMSTHLYSNYSAGYKANHGTASTPPSSYSLTQKCSIRTLASNAAQKQPRSPPYCCALTSM